MGQPPASENMVAYSLAASYNANSVRIPVKGRFSAFSGKSIFTSGGFLLLG